MPVRNAVEIPDRFFFKFRLQQAMPVRRAQAALDNFPYPHFVERQIREVAFGVNPPGERNSCADILRTRESYDRAFAGRAVGILRHLAALAISVSAADGSGSSSDRAV